MEAKEYDWETSYRRRIEEQNAGNRRFAAMTGSLAPIMNTETGRVRMERLRPGQRAYYEHNGVRHLFCGPARPESRPATTAELRAAGLL